MTQFILKQAASTQTFETTPRQGAMAMCPMGKMCARMMEKRPSGLLLVLPGILFILLGALIVIEPRVLVWLIAAASVFIGAMLLMLAWFIRRLGDKLRA